MNQFQAYFNTGIHHVLNIYAFHHILFIAVLCAIYLLRDWKKLLVLATGFTVGHLIALGIAILNLFSISNNLVNFLIPILILITAFFNILKPRPSSGNSIQANYVFALFYGLIHALGYSNYLRGKFGSGTAIIEPMLGFNLGVEVGQLAVVGILILLSSILIGLLGVNRKEWALVLSSLVMGMAIMMVLDARYW
ncbi:HupE/UreJ family protein [Echinicola jeungdonensis]|uniref:HupE/UreJ family protein n=1 Tax=Echinicola jeungdonensis TaxID=709343 RepID=A0ABV5J823_9BACT|nr:HupE/UreJ family protein [Echinicola jeungdonensis]MDN3669316.1 HupE/UreJ family protein [Echinicola jeungdonensis]